MLAPVDDVARFTRAWIETIAWCRPSVARFTRAWIETSSIARQIAIASSPASRGRGLKPSSEVGVVPGFARFTRAWIETYAGNLDNSAVSPASRGRGLKLDVRRSRASLSPASRGRGLKPLRIDAPDAWEVARFTRAWIETRGDRRSVVGRPLHAGVD